MQSNSYVKLMHNYGRRVLVHHCVQSQVSFASGPTQHFEDRTCIKFNEQILKRKTEAKNSVQITLGDKKSTKSLYKYAKSFGKIERCYSYYLPNKQKNVLIEFEDYTSVADLLTNCHFKADVSVIPVHSHFLNYDKSGNTDGEYVDEVIEETLRSECHLQSQLNQKNNIGEQIQTVYDTQKVTDLETRIRFMICHQFERMLIGIFPLCNILPFGSSVNGFGRKECDLDMILQLDSEQSDKTDKHLYFQSMPSLTQRILVQRSLDTIGGMLHDFAPGCSRLQRILNARVPILKFHHLFTLVDCDVTLFNKSGFYMSEILNIFSECDPRVRLLAFTIRKWAETNFLTNHSPGRWITNFSLILMVIFFLQRRPNPILPALLELKEMAEPADKLVVEGIDCTYLRNVAKIPKTCNAESIDSLLKEFFQFYSAFDYKTFSISILHGYEVIKPEYDSLFIQNPLEPQLNVSKNVSHEELVRLQACMQNSLWKLENDNLNSSKLAWGISKIFASNDTNKVSETKKYGFAVDHLFVKGSASSDTTSSESNLDILVDKVAESKVPTRKWKSKASKDMKNKSTNVTNSV